MSDDRPAFIQFSSNHYFSLLLLVHIRTRIGPADRSDEHVANNFALHAPCQRATNIERFSRVVCRAYIICFPFFFAFEHRLLSYYSDQAEWDKW
jgi:hypothetical protein